MTAAIAQSLLSVTPNTEENDMNLDNIKNWIRKLLSPNARPLADRAAELTNTLGKFLPRDLAIAITGRVFSQNPKFDLWSDSCELARYLLNQAIGDFLAKVDWLEKHLGQEVAQHWVRAVREGRELFFPPYLQGCFGSIEGHRGGGR